MAKDLDIVYNAIMKFTEGNFRNRVFVAPDIPAKKLVNARGKYITRDEPIVVLIDDTLFGSAKDGLAISENYVYAKGTLGDIKSVKISSIRSVSSQSNKLGSLDIYFGGNLFVTLSTIDKEDHDFVIGILKAAYAASKSVENSAPAKVKKPTKPVAAEPKPKNSNLGKETVTCSECSANLPAGAKFCLECGTKVLPKGVCLECNAKLPEKAKFCSECGTAAGKVPAKPVQPKVDTQALTAAPVDGGRRGAINSSEGMVSGEIVDWHQAADRAFNFFFNAIRKGEDTDAAAEWFRGEIADQTEAAGIVYEYGWEQEITPSQLQIISNTVANRLKGLNDEQGYQVSSDFYHGFIASFSNIIYNRSQEGNGDFEDLQEYWDQTIGNELPEECGTRNEGGSLNSDLQLLADKTEVTLTASGKLARYFTNCDNLFTTISIEHGPGNLLKVSVVVETDGQADDIEEVEEAIGDYIFDTFLTAGLIEIFGEEGYEELEFDNHFNVKNIDSMSSNGRDPSLDLLSSDPSIQQILQSVDDKLLERGTLVKILKVDDAEVSINFEFINPYNMDQGALFIVINISDEDADPDDIDDDDAEAVGDFVYAKISEMSDEFSDELKEAFENIEGTVLRVNGIYKG